MFDFQGRAFCMTPNCCFTWILQAFVKTKSVDRVVNQ